MLCVKQCVGQGFQKVIANIIAIRRRSLGQKGESESFEQIAAGKIMIIRNRNQQVGLSPKYRTWRSAACRNFRNDKPELNRLLSKTLLERCPAQLGGSYDCGIVGFDMNRKAIRKQNVMERERRVGSQWIHMCNPSCGLPSHLNAPPGSAWEIKRHQRAYPPSRRGDANKQKQMCKNRAISLRNSFYNLFTSLKLPEETKYSLRRLLWSQNYRLLREEMASDQSLLCWIDLTNKHYCDCLRRFHKCIRSDQPGLGSARNRHTPRRQFS